MPHCLLKSFFLLFEKEQIHITYTNILGSRRTDLIFVLGLCWVCIGFVLGLRYGLRWVTQLIVSVLISPCVGFAKAKRAPNSQ